MNTRLILEYSQGREGARRLRVAKSPLVPVRAMLYEIQAAGLILVEDAIDAFERPFGADTGAQTIQVQSSLRYDHSALQGQHTLALGEQEKIWGGL